MRPTPPRERLTAHQACRVALAAQGFADARPSGAPDGRERGGTLRAMADYTIRNLRDDVEDSAPKFGHSPDMEARFGRRVLGAEQSGVSYFRLAPGFRAPFGHTHSEQEETYVLVDGSARIKLDDDVVELRAWDAVRIAPGVWRNLEAGPEGVGLIAFGAGPSGDSEMAQGWWSD
jgi:quercetin dioxygenase-like cupin family protein